MERIEDQQTVSRQLPAVEYIRRSQLLGEQAVSPAEAIANRASGKGPRRARPGFPAIVPWSRATLWRKIKSKEFPAPFKLSERVNVWRVEAVLAWLAAQACTERKAHRLPPARRDGAAEEQSE
jgi:predicted DNA-binding transcriptional regulator AlpA